MPSAPAGSLISALAIASSSLVTSLSHTRANSSGGGTVGQVRALSKLLRPHLLRREKADVEKSLLALQETLLFVEITNLQKLCYRACLEQNRELLLRGVGSQGGGHVTFNNVSMMLRHCCNHPWLIREIEESALEQLQHESEVREPQSLREHNDEAYWRELRRGMERADSERYIARLVESSGKLVLLSKLLPKLKVDHGNGDPVTALAGLLAHPARRGDDGQQAGEQRNADHHEGFHVFHGALPLVMQSVESAPRSGTKYTAQARRTALGVSAASTPS